MAKIILYEFSVNPAGPARWRYARAVIDDETFVITQEDVPGKLSINEPCKSDYNRTSSPVANGAKISQFFRNGFKITTYAQDCSPFANAVVVAEAPPAPPTPPPNPFGTATYGLFKFFEFCNIDARTVRTEIEKKEFIGIATEIVEGDATPLVVSHKPVDEITDQIHPTELIMNFIASVDFGLSDLFLDDERMYRVTSYYTDTMEILFKGFIVAQSGSEPFVAAPYPISVKATDGLGALKKITYPIPYGGKTNLRQSWLSIIQYCLSKTGIDLPIYTMCNLYEVKNPNTLDDDPLFLNTVNPLRFSDDKGNIFDCYRVLQEVCKEFTCYITQSEGAWRIIRVPELSNPVVRQRKYNPDGSFSIAEQVDNVLTLGSENTDVELLADANIEIHNAYKRVVVLQRFGFVPSVIFNGDFSEGDNVSLPYWSIFGLDYSRVQNSIPGVNGQPVLIDDYSLQFNQKYDLSKWAQPNNIRITAGDKVSLSFNLGSNSPLNIMDYMYMRISIQNADGSAVWMKVSDPIVQNNQLTPQEPTWQPNLQTVELALGKGPKDIGVYIYTINMPVAPIDGDLILQFFGFVKRTGRFVGNQDQEYTYSPMQLDNIKIAITNINNNAIPDGIVYVSEQQRFFTQSPEVKELLFGDNVNIIQTTNVTQSANVLLRNNISSIYTNDGSYSSTWYEFGLSSEQLPIANWAAKSALKLFQTPFRLFQCSMMGYFSFVNTFEICFLPGERYAIASGDFDVKWKRLDRAVLTQIFYKNILTNDFGAPHNPGQIFPPYIQNANLPVNVFGTGIFTEEFTEEFV